MTSSSRWATKLPARLLCSIWAFVPSIVDVAHCRAVCSSWNLPADSAPLQRTLNARYASDWPFAGEREQALAFAGDNTWLARHARRYTAQRRLLAGDARRQTKLDVSLIPPEALANGDDGDNDANWYWPYGPNGGRFFVLAGDCDVHRVLIFDTANDKLVPAAQAQEAKTFTAEQTARHAFAFPKGVLTEFDCSVKGTVHAVNVLDVACDMLFTKCSSDRFEARFVDQWSLPTLEHVRRFGPTSLVVLTAAATGSRLLVWSYGSDTADADDVFSVYDVHDGSRLCVFALRRLFFDAAISDEHVARALLFCFTVCGEVAPKEDLYGDDSLQKDTRSLNAVHSGWSLVRYIVDNQALHPWHLAVAPRAGKLVIGSVSKVEIWCPRTGRCESTVDIACCFDSDDAKQDGARGPATVCVVPLGAGLADEVVLYTCHCRTHAGEVWSLLLKSCNESAVLRPLTTLTLSPPPATANVDLLFCATPSRIYTTVLGVDDALQAIGFDNDSANSPLHWVKGGYVCVASF